MLSLVHPAGCRGFASTTGVARGLREPKHGTFVAFTFVDDVMTEWCSNARQPTAPDSGTLDKYLGDGLMATFGTPFAGEADASNALRCAQAMMSAADRWSGERKAAGEAPIRVSFGLHYGPVLLGDIGLTCLEFAVIGSTVNIASRLEALTARSTARW